MKTGVNKESRKAGKTASARKTASRAPIPAFLIKSPFSVPLSLCGKN
jgi:hypothetical protein